MRVLMRCAVLLFSDVVVVVRGPCCTFLCWTGASGCMHDAGRAVARALVHAPPTHQETTHPPTQPYNQPTYPPTGLARAPDPLRPPAHPSLPAPHPSAPRLQPTPQALPNLCQDSRPKGSGCSSGGGGHASGCRPAAGGWCVPAHVLQPTSCTCQQLLLLLLLSCHWLWACRFCAGVQHSGQEGGCVSRSSVVCCKQATSSAFPSSPRFPAPTSLASPLPSPPIPAHVLACHPVQPCQPLPPFATHSHLLPFERIPRKHMAPSATQATVHPNARRGWGLHLWQGMWGERSRHSRVPPPLQHHG